ncbi:MAG: helix-turn-helix transcriptional regulator [Thermomicrobiales bacterium]
MNISPSPSVGDILRTWRQRRRFSQLDLASEAAVSTRHLSFVETGRANASREMLLHLAQCLEMPLGERNALLAAAGYAPVYPRRELDDPAMRAVRETIDLLLRGHEPHPSLVIDRHWNLVAANRVLPLLLGDVAPVLMTPPVNILRLAVHPEGLASRIVNAREYIGFLVARLRHEVAVSGDPVLAALLEELGVWRHEQGWDDRDTGWTASHEIAVPFRIRTDLGILSFLGTTTVFGTATDITVSELTIESFFPLDSSTRDALVGLSRSLSSGEHAG